MNALGVVACLCFPLAVAGLELLRRYLAARVCGWPSLHRRYPGVGSVVGRPSRGAVRVNARPCDPSPTVTLTGGGLHLTMGPLIARAGHGPLFIPWDDVTVVLDDAATAGELPLWIGDDAATLTLAGPAATAAARLLARRRHRPARRSRR